MELCSIKSSANNKGAISGGWEDPFQKHVCVPRLFLYFPSFFFRFRLCVSNPRSGFLQTGCSANAFQKPFFKAQWSITVEV